MAEASDAPAAAAVQPLQVAYCTVSGFPYEYCEFHPDFKKCIAAAAADPSLHRYLPIIMNQRAASRRPLPPLSPPPPSPTSLTPPSLPPPGIESLLASLTLDAPASEAAAAAGGAAAGGEAAAAGAGAKGKKEKEKAVLIFESKKNKGKKATVVRGLDAFGVKLSDASKVNLEPRV